MEKQPDDSIRNVIERVTSSLAGLLDAWIRDEQGTQSFSSVEYDGLLRSALDHLELCAHRVRIELNTRALVNRLPDDVLGSILEYLHPQKPETFSLSQRFATPGYRPSPQSALHRWMKLSMVCRRWRDMITSSPTFWTYITIGPAYTPTKIIDTQLRFTGNTPIDFHACVETSYAESFRTPRFDWENVNFRPLIHRLRSFHLYDVPYPRCAQVCDQLDGPAVLLENLTLYPAMWSRGGTGTTTKILPILFQGSTPRLKALTLGYFLSWQGNQFRNLTYLCLADQAVATNPLTNVEDVNWTTTFLFGFLSESPALEFLILHNTCRLIEDSASTPRGSPIVHLPYLAVLHISGWDPSSSNLLLTNLEIPQLCAIYIDPTNQHNRPDPPSAAEGLSQSLANFHSGMSAYLSNITRLYLRSITSLGSSPLPYSVVACGSAGLYLKPPKQSLQLVEWNEPGQPAAPVAIIVPEAGFVEATHEGEYTHIPNSAAHLHIYAAMNISELWLDTHHHMRASIPQWNVFYDAIPGITKVVVITKFQWGEPDLRCIEALFTMRDGILSCPNLTKMQVFYDGGVSVHVLHAISQLLEARRAAGCPVTSVSVGILPPLELSEDVLQSIVEILGPDGNLGTREPTFDFAPFSERFYPGVCDRSLRGRGLGERKICGHVFCSCRSSVDTV